MHASIIAALEAVKQNRTDRWLRIFTSTDAVREATLRGARHKEALRRKRDEEFQPRDNDALALTEWKIEQHKAEGRLVVLDEENPNLIPLMALMRHNHIVGDGAVTPAQFRNAGHDVTAALFAYALMHYRIDPEDAAVSFMWRAAMLGANAAYDAGFRNFFHFDANRNEATAKCSPIRYFEAPGARTDWPICFVLDFMLATGGSDAEAILKLKEHGLLEKQIVVLAGIAAPEGVDRLLYDFPGIDILTVALDERLNKAAYITPGLGDAGDQSFADRTPDDAVPWYDRGILSADSLIKLQARMLAAAQQVA